MVPYFYQKETQTPKRKRIPDFSYLELYPVAKGEEKPLILVIPGGGYRHLAVHEGQTVAEWLNSKGIAAAVFYYQLDPFNLSELLSQLNECLEELQRTKRLGNITFKNLGLIGFSAGGHLAALASTKNLYKPDFTILSYPVITMKQPFVHTGSAIQIFGEHFTDKDTDIYSAENWVDETTPPLFIWHTVDDQSVAVENTLLFVEQLCRYQIPLELHLFPKGRHGLGLAAHHPVGKWTKLLEEWLQTDFIIQGGVQIE